ncbi:MAG TPA: heterodisulfide reductase-related iron-sulfur binding cluster, partial [Casimicrobiaceae bacterium]|nr:heterodisulfide reductase-related iron-sulfur binding cluster [Casimicrobiaceae bacterium]
TERLTGISRHRTLPRWRRDTFLRDWRKDAPRATTPDVVLFVDTFTDRFEPANARAALDVLGAAGYRVDVARPAQGDAEPSRALCCGRTWLAHGLVDQAKREARRVVDALAPQVLRGATVVGLEPSCLLSLRDEFLVMGLPEAAKRIGEQAMLIEEFLVREHDEGRLALALEPLPEKRALVHAHCHQKAFDAASATHAMLRLVPGLVVEPIESSCCGMAGAFGYGSAHYDVSMRMAEASLLPAVRAATPDTLVVAGGTSCRHQIADGTRATGRVDAVHPIRVIERALAGGPGPRRAAPETARREFRRTSRP